MQFNACLKFFLASIFIQSLELLNACKVYNYQILSALLADGFEINLNFFIILALLQVVLEGLWQEGFVAIAAIGATNIGSIEVETNVHMQSNHKKEQN